eukprot:5362599-Pleurochrysis_carterae.AAC.1
MTARRLSCTSSSLRASSCCLFQAWLTTAIRPKLLTKQRRKLLACAHQTHTAAFSNARQALTRMTSITPSPSPRAAQVASATVAAAEPNASRVQTC